MAAFDSLLLPRGYRRLRTDRWRWSTTTSYGGRDPGVEFVLDWREYRAYTRLIQLEEGLLPPDEPYPVHEAARRYLETALRTLSVLPPLGRDRDAREGQRPSEGASTVRDEVSEQFALLREHLQVIESRWREAFEA